jgi:protein N-terminal methyltransferase
MPELSLVPSAIRPLSPPPLENRTRALDVGAGIGRVTSDVLLHLVSDVLLVEPVEKFIHEAWSRGKASAERSTRTPPEWKGIADKSKSVTFLKGTLQSFDPLNPRNPEQIQYIGRVGYQPEVDDIDSGFDVIWCQWCLGHLSEGDLVTFFKRCQLSLRDPAKGRSLIVVKENVCWDGPDGLTATVTFDEQDSSLTRSDLAWKTIFKKAGLKLVREKEQLGFPGELYDVKMYALR